MTQHFAHTSRTAAYLSSINDPTAEPPLGQPGDPGTQTQGSTAVLERTEEEHSPGDNERYAHYVRKERLMRSLIDGGPVVALCGKVWIPVRDPDRFPICPTCKEIHDHLGSSDGVWPLGPNAPQ